MFTNKLSESKRVFCFNFWSKLFDLLQGDSRGREHKKTCKQAQTEVPQGVSILYYISLFMIEGVLSWAPMSSSQKKRRNGCLKVNQEITIKFFCCLVEVFRMCFLYIFIHPNWECFKIEWLAVKTCLLQAEKKNAGVSASKLITLCTQLTATVTLSDW